MEGLTLHHVISLDQRLPFVSGSATRSPEITRCAYWFLHARRLAQYRNLPMSRRCVIVYLLTYSPFILTTAPLALFSTTSAPAALVRIARIGSPRVPDAQLCTTLSTDLQSYFIARGVAKGYPA